VSHRQPLVCLALSGLLLLASAAGAAESKTGWYEVTTPHITIKTDLSLDDAQHAAVLAEQTRAALLSAAFSGAKLSQERFQIVIFRSHQDFEGYFGDFVDHKWGLVDFPPTVFIFGSPYQWEKRGAVELDTTTSVLKRTLAQHLEASIYRRLPRWFSVGLAEFLETLHLAEDGKSATLGGLNIPQLTNFKTHRHTGVAEALAWGTTLNPTDEGTLLGLQGISWLMVEWMFNTRSAEFIRFQKLLISGMEPTKAWNVVLPADVRAGLDQEFNRFAQYGPFGASRVAIPEGEYTIDSDRPLNSAEVHAIRAEAALAAGHAKDAQSELSAALADDPGNVAALRRQVPLAKPAERLALARRATTAHPEDGLSWLLVGDALEGSDNTEERLQAYRKASELSPGHPAAFNALAVLSLQKSNAEEALPRALTAVRMAPWEPVYLQTLASAMAAAGRCGEATSTQARAVDSAAEKGGPTERAAYAARLSEIQKTCVEAPAAAAATPSGETSPGPKP